VLCAETHGWPPCFNMSQGNAVVLVEPPVPVPVLVEPPLPGLHVEPPLLVAVVAVPPAPSDVAA